MVPWRSADNDISVRRVGCPQDAFLLFGPPLSRLPCERVAVAFLAADRAVIAVVIVAEGDRAAAALPAVEIVRGAVLSGAAGILVAHNHPSGDATPSLADIRATRTLAASAQAVGVALVDHVVLARDEARSFRLMGLI